MYSLTCYSYVAYRADAWAGLTKPVATFAVGDIRDCAFKCNMMRSECGLIQYNEATKACSPAKVASHLTNKIHCRLPTRSSRLTAYGMCTR